MIVCVVFNGSKRPCFVRPRGWADRPLPLSCACLGRRRKCWEGGRATTLSLQATGQRAGSVSLAQKLCSFPLHNQESITRRARGPKVTAEGWAVSCACYVAKEHTTQTVLNERNRKSARLLPGVPIFIAVGARDQMMLLAACTRWFLLMYKTRRAQAHAAWAVVCVWGG